MFVDGMTAPALLCVTITCHNLLLSLRELRRTEGSSDSTLVSGFDRAACGNISNDLRETESKIERDLINS